MTRQVVRIAAEATNREGESLVLEVLLQEGRLVGRVPFFGIRGKFQGEFFPFVLQPNGEMDFGSDFEDRDRFFLTNIWDRDVRIGSQFTAEQFDSQEGARQISCMSSGKLTLLRKYSPGKGDCTGG